MAAAFSLILFLYICLVFLVTHRICLMQCNPMGGPGMYSGDINDVRFSGSRQEVDNSVRDRRDQLGQFNMRQIRFDPSYLDFHEQPVGMPKVKTVTIQNPTTEKNLQLLSISGNTVHFYASFFQSKIVHPLGNTTFDIVFLARVVGNAENTLFIHTSKGVYPYQVFGVGIANPYRLRPFLGARVPVNFSFTSLINMHNPYNTPLQVIEMYSSGGGLHLELPSGQEEAPQKHWEIPPYETKAVMRVSFLNRMANNHTAFIRIKATSPAPVNELLILPVEVEVSAVPGLYSSVDLLDFGTLRTMDEPKSIGLYLLNSGLKQIHISSVVVEPANTAVKVSFLPTVLKPGHKHLKVATITYTAYNAKRSRQRSGKIVIKTSSKSIPRFEVPYQANILQGTIAYSVSKTRFFVGKPSFLPVVRELPITNTFGFTMIVYDAQFPTEVQDVFSVVNFTKPAMIEPQKTLTPFYLQFQANRKDVAFSTILRVYTNASIFTVPIHCYDGKVKYYWDGGGEERVMDYGIVGTGENRTKLLKVVNTNPVEVTVSQITSSIEFMAVKLMEVKHGNESKQHKSGTQAPAKVIPGKSADITKVSIKPGYIASFIVELCVPKKEDQYSGNIEVLTDYEALQIPVSLKAMDGKISVSPSSVVFQPSFPGRIESHALVLSSSFSHPVKLLSVLPHPLDGRFYFVSQSNGHPELVPNKKQKVGMIKFDPKLGCKSHCYVGLGKQNKAWLSSLSLPTNVGDLDGQFMDKLRQIYSLYEQSGRLRMNVSFMVDTDVVKGIKLPAKATFTWPSLSPDKPVKFPLTQIGNYSIKTFMLENPSDMAVVAQVVPLFKYPQFQGVLDFVADRLDTDSYEPDQGEHSCFSLPKAEAPKAGRSSLVSRVLVVEPRAGTNVVLLKPRTRVKIPIQFEPADERLRTSVILIRNNLTVLDALVVQGQGARGEFMLNGKNPGLHSTLLFELKSSHLTDCHKTSLRSHSFPSLSVKKTLTATNPGQLAILVSSLSINGYECEGYGFKVMNCKSFILKPNSSRKIEIAFTPDFSMSRVTRKLQVKTTFGPIMEFTLVATIPPHLLPLCAVAIGRMAWEPGPQIVAAIIMFVLFLAILLAAYTEARKLVFLSSPEMQMLQMGHEERGKVFDLNAIAGVKSSRPPVKEDRVIATKRSKKDAKDIKDSTPQDRNQNGDYAATNFTPLLPNNNNVNKSNSSARQPENVGNRIRAHPRLAQFSSDCSYDKRAESYDTRKPGANKEESKLRKNSCEKGDRNNESSLNAAISRRTYDTAVKKSDSKSNEEARSVALEDKCKISNLHELEFENVIKNDLSKKESKDKSKVKKKTKASRREDREREKRGKDKNSSKQLDRVESEDSGSDSSSEKNVPDVKFQHLSKSDKKPRRSSLPSLISSNTKLSNVSETQDPQTKSKNRKNLSDGKKTKVDAQPPKTKNPENINKKGSAANLVADTRSESTHSIATAVSLALEKSLQTACKENNYDELERSMKKKTFQKTSNLSPHLRDSPPPISPTGLSGSSRSSSYSSIVSSDGASSTPDHIKGKGKARIISSKSLPLGDPSLLFRGVTKDQSVGPVGSRKGKGRHLSGLTNNPWSMSPDSCMKPIPIGCPQVKSPTSPYRPIASSSLFENYSFSKTEGIPTNPDNSMKGLGMRLPSSVLSPTVWEGRQPNPCLTGSKAQDKRFENPDSLFSYSTAADDPFPGRLTRKANNWVNFLDGAGSIQTTSPQLGLNKTVSEIWDSRTSPPEGDGWSLYNHSFQSNSDDGKPLSCEAEPVDALFKEDSSFVSTAENLAWGQSMPQLWGNNFVGSTTTAMETLPVSSGATGFSVTPGIRPNGELVPQSPPASSFGSLGGDSIWGPTPWSSANN